MILPMVYVFLSKKYVFGRKIHVIWEREHGGGRKRCETAANEVLP